MITVQPQAMRPATASPGRIAPPRAGILGVGAALSVLFLYGYIASIGAYAVTVGGIFCGIVALASLRRIKLNAVALYLFVAFLILPLLVGFFAIILHAELAPPSSQFLQSFGLWVVSLSLVVLGFLSTRPVLVAAPFLINVVIVVIACLQVIGVRVFNTYIGFELVQPLIGFDIFKSYLNIFNNAEARAIGTYYEASMCGRVIVTLAVIDYMINRKLARNVALILIGLVTTQSLGLLALAAVLGAVIVGVSARELVLIVVASTLAVPAGQIFLSQRFTAQSFQSSDSSNYRRVVAPINTMGYSLAHYPLGLPIGAEENLAIETGYFQDTGEVKITNGLYQFIMLFGLLGILSLAYALILLFGFQIGGEREYAAIVIYVLLSTAASGSPLLIESSLLIYYFVVACRYGRARRIAEQAARR
ncbi:MAG: hypothetical protein JWM38_1881 [Sphingomonas bacterium]|jgi:hypothetical protein|nr:hypothetical protein [Sphingomonas bacterium]